MGGKFKVQLTHTVLAWVASRTDGKVVGVVDDDSTAAMTQQLREWRAVGYTVKRERVQKGVVVA